MPDETPKKGMVNALSRILHLHPLPSAKTNSKWPTIANSEISEGNSNSTTPSSTSPISPASISKPIIIPETSRARTSIVPTSSSPPMATARQPLSPFSPHPQATAPKNNPPFTAPWLQKKALAPSVTVVRAPETTVHSPPKPATLISNSKPIAPAMVPAPATPLHSAIAPTAPLNERAIVTNYDRILDMVQLNKSMKLDEISKKMNLSEETVAEELQTLEDNGLIEVRYPAFGEPIIYYKNL